MEVKKTPKQTSYPEAPKQTSKPTDDKLPNGGTPSLPPAKQIDRRNEK